MPSRILGDQFGNEGGSSMVGMAGRRTPEQVAKDAWSWHQKAERIYDKLYKQGKDALVADQLAALTALAETARTALYAEQVMQSRKRDEDQKV
ncbi:hypothetical protein [Amycolatopsis sp. NPDC004079]|uniref:hypothetical protein n=1 Tax=Amycolatopsis sp. NPDC004079 TaxID=3154549 RepID=UPI0033B46A80